MKTAMSTWCSDRGECWEYDTFCLRAPFYSSCVVLLVCDRPDDSRVLGSSSLRETHMSLTIHAHKCSNILYWSYMHNKIFAHGCDQCVAECDSGVQRTAAHKSVTCSPRAHANSLSSLYHHLLPSSSLSWGGFYMQCTAVYSRVHTLGPSSDGLAGGRQQLHPHAQQGG